MGSTGLAVASDDAFSLEQISGYQLGDKIGEGGMATVYKGLQLSLKRPVAIKVLLTSLGENPFLREHFDQESLIIARLNNPHIIHVIDRGITQNGMPYFVMEYIEGTDLQVAIRAGDLDYNRKLDLIIQVCKALSYAHRNGVVHRDIKPSNVLIDRDGNARVLDFGIAQLFEETSHDKTKTRPALIMGTLPYMSPEQRNAIDKITSQSDLYSLGALIYELFTGCKPLGSFRRPSEINAKVPLPLEGVIMSCLEPDPTNRPSSADEIKDILLKLLRGAHLDSDQKTRASQGISSVKEKFALLDVIKEDKYGAVYLYEDKRDHDLLVIKKKPKTNSGLTEAKLLTTFKHKNIVNILGASKDSLSFIIVMEYLSGGNLKDRLIQPLPLGEVLYMVREICDGLAYAHKNQIIHGNLRPSNILFTESGQIKIADFGLDEHYVYNEKSNNWYRNNSETKSPYTDIYSMGVVFYQMLTGVLPEWKRNKLVSNKYFKGLEEDIQKLVIRMLGYGKDDFDIGLEDIMTSLDGFMETYDTTVVQKVFPEVGGSEVKSGDRESSKGFNLLRIIFLFFITNIIFAAAFAGYLVFTGELQIDMDSFQDYWEKAKDLWRNPQDFWGKAQIFLERVQAAGKQFMEYLHRRLNL